MPWLHQCASSLVPTLDPMSHSKHQWRQLKHCSPPRGHRGSSCAAHPTWSAGRSSRTLKVVRALSRHGTVYSVHRLRDCSPDSAPSTTLVVSFTSATGYRRSLPWNFLVVFIAFLVRFAPRGLACNWITALLFACSGLIVRLSRWICFLSTPRPSRSSS